MVSNRLLAVVQQLTQQPPRAPPAPLAAARTRLGRSSISEFKQWSVQWQRRQPGIRWPSIDILMMIECAQRARGVDIFSGPPDASGGGNDPGSDGGDRGSERAAKRLMKYLLAMKLGCIAFLERVLARVMTELFARLASHNEDATVLPTTGTTLLRRVVCVARASPPNPPVGRPHRISRQCETRVVP